MQAKPALFFEASVRHLFLSSSSKLSVAEARTLLRRCRRIVSLFVLPPFSTGSLIREMTLTQMKKWADYLGDLFGCYDAIDLSHPVFRSVTHIDISEQVRAGDTRICPGLVALPALTHLCLNNDVPVAILRRMLDECAQLQVLVNLWSHHVSGAAYHVASNPPVSDVRFVVVIFTNYWRDWEAGARGHTDFWAAADAFVARKRRCDIAEKVYTLLPLCMAFIDPHQASSGACVRHSLFTELGVTSSALPTSNSRPHQLHLSRPSGLLLDGPSSCAEQLTLPANR
ncbi:hypothetical protein DFH07DRAFT_1068461 [Mycena maculata]|uniref:Uncharacterized protein n=1 Tax=Mycena maculata TaxID=230809 RepID=A0AAD7HA70_9AGAR|nr:hypothetical protein DFH07DRAFT_1068461 [Mycena maculata]